MSIHIPIPLYIGLQESFTKVVTEGEAALYAGLVGDNQPRVQSTIGHEPGKNYQLTVHPEYLVGMIGGLLKARFPGEGSQCISVQYEFLTPVFCGDRIDTVIELVVLDPGKHLATFRTDCFNQAKTQVITGQVVMLVPADILP